MDLNYYKPLASILQDAQGAIDPDTGLPIDIGGHVVELRQICDRLRAELAECRRGTERYRTALEQIVAPFEDLNFVSGNKLLTYIHDVATAALAAKEEK